MRTLTIFLVLAVFLTAGMGVSSASGNEKSLGVLDFFRLNTSVKNQASSLNLSLGNLSNNSNPGLIDPSLEKREENFTHDDKTSLIPNIIYIDGEEKEVVLDQSTEVQDLGIANIKSDQDRGFLRFFFHNISGGKIKEAYARVTLEQNDFEQSYAQNVSGSTCSYITLYPSVLTDYYGAELNKNVSIRLELLSNLSDPDRRNNVWEGIIKLEGRELDEVDDFSDDTSLFDDNFEESINDSEEYEIMDDSYEDSWDYVDDVCPEDGSEEVFLETSEEDITYPSENIAAIKVLNGTPLQKKVLPPVKVGKK